MKYDLNRKVGTESRRSYKEKCENGFFDKYMSGKGCELGYASYEKGCLPILPDCDGYDKGTNGYDGLNIPKPDGYYDYLYSSHTLEHIVDFGATLKEWYRVVKENGHLVIVVPHQFLYEKKKEKPSKWNGDHKRFYTPASLMKEIEDSLEPNTYRVVLLKDNDKDFNYDLGPSKHSSGAYEIELVLKKIKKPSWELL